MNWKSRSGVGTKKTRQARSWLRCRVLVLSRPVLWLRLSVMQAVKQFENGRQLAAWLGLVPKQRSSGGKQTLLGISKRGDVSLRTLLIHRARAVLRVAERKREYAGSWLARVME